MTMSYRSLMAAAASAAILVAAPAFAQGHGGGGGGGAGAGGPPAGAGPIGGVMNQGPMSTPATGIMNASPNSVLNRTTTTAPTTSTTTGTNFSTNSRATVHSQGPVNASPTGISHASSNSVLARGAVTSSALPGLTTGLVVNNSGGTRVGTVTRVITGPNNTIRAVVVTSASGRTFTLPPSSLSISGNIVTTTSTRIGR